MTDKGSTEMTRVVQYSPLATGLKFTQLVIAAAIACGNSDAMASVAKERFGEDSLAFRVAASGGTEIMNVTKAEVAAGATVSGSWAELLAEEDGARAEFFALVRERSILGRIVGLRRVPLRVRMIGMTTGVNAAWVGEGRAVAVSSAIFGQELLEPRKLATLVVLTEELLRSSGPAAEAMIRDDLVNALATAINTSFLDPTNAGEVGVQPAAITYNAPSVTATGDGLFDIRELIAAFPGDLERAVMVGSPLSFAAMHDPIYLPGLGVRGGNALGIPAIASTAAGDTIALVDPTGIAWGEGRIDIRATRKASIEMVDNAPAGDVIAVVPGTAASMVSMFTTNSVAVMADQSLNWQAGRPSVAVMTGVPES